MKSYRVKNRITKDIIDVERAESAQEACGVCGWMIGDCYVKVISDMQPLSSEEKAMLERIRQQEPPAND